MSQRVGETDRKSVLKDALRAVEEMQARLEAAERKHSDPIAVVGLACRFPGDADTPEAYWKLLRDGVDAIREVPADRWNAGAYAELDPETAADMPTQYAVGKSIAEAFLSLYIFESTCQIQISAQAGGELTQVDPRIVAGTAQAMKVQTDGIGAAFVWPAMLRKLERSGQGAYET